LFRRGFYDIQENQTPPKRTQGFNLKRDSSHLMNHNQNKAQSLVYAKNPDNTQYSADKAHDKMQTPGKGYPVNNETESELDSNYKSNKMIQSIESGISTICSQLILIRWFLGDET